MSILKKEYRYVFLFPGPAGYMLATALKRTGTDVLVINHPHAKYPSVPEVLSRAVYLPDVFTRDITGFGFPEPELGNRVPLMMHIGSVGIEIAHDTTRQILAMANALPKLDTKLMKLITRLDGYYKRNYDRFERIYSASSGKSMLGYTIMKSGALPPIFTQEPMAGIPDTGDGLIARWAVALPGYLSLGLQGPTAGLKALAFGFGLRCPYFCNYDSERLNIDTEHMYMNEGGDFVDAEGDDLIEATFTGGAKGTLMVNGCSVDYIKAFIAKDIAARVFVGQEQLYPMLHGLTLISRSFTWNPPERLDKSQPLHGMILSDPMRPPVNDNLVMYSIDGIDTESPTVSLAVTLERSEMLLEHFSGKRHNHLVARMAGNFMVTIGGELTLEGALAEPTAPPLKVHGRGSFRFYSGNLSPGYTLEDLARRARWLSEQPEFRRLW